MRNGIASLYDAQHYLGLYPRSFVFILHRYLHRRMVLEFWIRMPLLFVSSHNLIKQWLKAPIIGEDDNGVKKTVGGKANRKAA